MPQRNVATNFTFEQQRLEINLLAQDFWTQKGTVDTASTTYLKHDGTNAFTGATLAVPNAFTINSNSGNGTVTISGNLDVTGTTTTVSSANLEVTDKNILISKGSTTDSQADGAGITIDSDTDITWNFVDANDAWVSSIGIEATTHLKAARGQFTGATSPTTGSGVEVNAPDANTGQIIAYNRGTSTYNELRLRGSSVPIYTGTTNAIVGTFNSTGLTMESGKGITCPGNLDVDGSSTFGANGSITSGADFSLSSNKFRVTGTDTVGLEVQRAGNATIQCTDTTNSTDLQLRANSDGGLVRTATDKPLIFGTFQEERLRIQNDKAFVTVNHGNAENNSALILSKTDAGYAKLEFDVGTSQKAYVELDGSENLIHYGAAGVNQQFYAGGTNRVDINSTTDVNTLDVYGGARADYFVGRSNVSTPTADASMYRSADNTLEFATASTPRLTITSGGEVLIGRDTKPNDINKLVVTGTSPADSYDSQIYLEGSETTGAVDTGGALAFGGHDGSQYRNWANIYGMKENATGGNSASYMSFHTRAAGGNPAEKVRITSDGHVLPSTDNTLDLGSPTMRWANLYTGDLNLCNEGSYNEVDGTSGSWTMQEGDSDLFLINRKSGKKYKFNLTEVA